ncbi:META domain-containing protein [Halomonas sp. 1390]|uniref:META domain-containing protein n=1 Tax=Halomonas sp. B23F22_3 TaxID=3459516 RepID=UPI00373E243B
MRFPTFILILLTPALLQAAESPLDDTHWQLVEIQSMDDTSRKPEDPSRYTLDLKSDGTALIQSDCNSATASWKAEGSQLTFGQLSSTRARCPDTSLDEVYRAQFKWVRSFVTREGHLFLATMADGAIIEFRSTTEPTASARVLGEDISSTDPLEIQSTVLTRLFDDYANHHNISVSQQEVDGYLATMDKRLKADLGDDYESLEDFSPAEAAEAREMRGAMASSVIRQWKINQSLYQKNGGRVIYQQLGSEPLDAYRQFLEERQQAGDFRVNDAGAWRAFWDDFTDADQHQFMDEDQAKKAFSDNPWEGT